MLLTHPEILSISIHGVEYRPDDGVFDMPDSAAAIAMAYFGMTEVKSGGPKRAKAGGPPSTKAKPRSRKPKAKAKGEGIYLPVAGSYSFTPSFCAPQPYINYKIQGTSCKTETAAESASASCIYHISDRIWPYCADSGSGEAISPALSSAPSNSVEWHGRPADPSRSAYLLRSGHWPGDTRYKLPGTSYKMKTVAARGVTSDIHRIGNRIWCNLPHRADWARGKVIRPALSFAAGNTIAKYGFPTGPSPGA